MPNKILVQAQDDTPPQLTFADFAADFAPTAANDLREGADTQVQLIFTSVADGAARQSTKGDLGENRAQEYAVRGAIEFAATPTAGAVVEVYAAPSASSTAGTGNAGNVSGADSAYSGYSSNLAASVLQLQLIGVFICTVQTTTTVQVAEIGRFFPTERHVSLVVKNESGAAFHSDDVECHIVLDPIIIEVQ